MSGFFLILMAIAMLALLASLLAGVFFMARGGEANRRYSNRLMRLRVGLQGLAIVLFILAIITQAS
ncbi:twin transmembrane helix small protein [Azospirillum sp. sgz301742]